MTPPAGAPRGVVAILLGGKGVGFTGVNRMFVSQLATDGFEVVIVSWEDPWLQAARGEDVGPARLACRSATAIKWIHDNLYERLGVPRAALGACGFCLHGNSGGATQIGYSLSLYGLGSIVDAAVLSGGPPHAAIAKGCLRERGYAYDNISAGIIDLSYGFPDGGGPCEKHDKSFQERWNQDSLDTAGGTYKFPQTRVAFVFVSGDPTVGPAHGRDYQAKLEAAHSPYVTIRTISGQSHTIEELPLGRAALENALLGSARS